MYMDSLVSNFATTWTIARQAPLSMEYWNRLPFPSPGDLPDPGIKPMFPVSPTSAGGFFFFFFNHCATWEACNQKVVLINLGFSNSFRSSYFFSLLKILLYLLGFN